MRASPCPQCGGRPTYNDAHDMFACVACDIWTEEPCNCAEAECPFPKAPPVPSLALQAIVVDAETFDQLSEAIENPRPPTEALKKLMRE